MKRLVLLDESLITEFFDANLIIVSDFTEFTENSSHVKKDG
jgi:hypothetical protein